MPEVDILFITHTALPRDTGSREVYDALRLQINNTDATIPVLRKLSSDESAASTKNGTAAYGIPPVLTPIYLRESMRRRDVRMTDIACLETDMHQVKEAIALGVGLIAFTTTWLPTPRGAHYLRKAISEVKAMAPDIPIVVGGVGVRKGLRARKLVAKSQLEGITQEQLAEEFVLIDANLDQDINAIIVGEGGEDTLAKLAIRIRNNEKYDDLPNLAIPTNDSYHFTQEESDPSNLDGEIVDWSRYTQRLGPFDAPIRTAAGCPFKCEFCDFSKLYTPKLRSIDSLLTELKTLSGTFQAPRNVFFADDNVAISQKRLTEFTRALVAEKMQISWRAFIRADSVDEESAELMRESGCRECFLGIESGDPEILSNMNKRLDPEKALRAIELLDKNGINTQCTFVVGFPGETERSIERTAAFISAFPSGETATAIQRYYLFRFQAWPLCPISSTAQRQRYQLDGLGENWSHSTMNSQEALHAMRDLFLKVQGPSHTYMELVPPDWPVERTREVMELRDAVKKAFESNHPDAMKMRAKLLETVRGKSQS